MRSLDSITEAMDMNLENSGRYEGQGGLACCSPWGRKELGHDWVTEQQHTHTCTHAYICMLLVASLVAQIVKNLSAMQAIWVQSLGREDSLEKGMATHSSIFAWRIPWTD